MIAAFGISWAMWVPLVLRTSLTPETQWLLYYGGVLGPAVAAIVCARASSGSTALLRRVRRWRVSLSWYAVAILLPFAIRAVAVGSALLYENHGWRIVLRPAPLIAGTTALMFLLVPLEEIGWRGYVLPVLQLRHSPLTSSLIVGGLWGLWHLPLAWATIGYQRSANPWSYMTWFCITILPVSCLATWLFNRTGESLLLVSLFHVAVNIADFVLVLPARIGQLILIATCIIATMVVVAIFRTDRLGTPLRNG